MNSNFFPFTFQQGHIIFQLKFVFFLQILRDVLPDDASDTEDLTPAQRMRVFAPTFESMGLDKPTQRPGPSSAHDSGELLTSDLDDEELDSYILSPDESEIKSKVWMAANGRVLEEIEVVGSCNAWLCFLDFFLETACASSRPRKAREKVRVLEGLTWRGLLKRVLSRKSNEFAKDISISSWTMSSVPYGCGIVFVQYPVI